MRSGYSLGKTRSWSYFSLALFVFGQLLRAQVFTATGGVSTISNAQGGQLTMTGSGYALSIGGGESNGQFAEGFRYVKQTARAKYILGDQYARFDLPTDVFDPGHFIDLLGVGVETTFRNASVLAFVGATSTDVSNPIFSAATADHAAAALLVRQKLSSSLKLTSYSLLSAKPTSIEGLQWTPLEHLTFAVSGGVGAGHAYGATSLDFLSPHFDVKAAFIYAGDQFQRYIGKSPALAEPDRGNIAFSWKPSGWVMVTGGHQSFLSSPSSNTPGLKTSLDDLSVGATILGAEVTATAFHSTYMASSTNAIACSAAKSLGRRLSLQGSYLEAWPSSGPPTVTLLTNVTETLTPRWTLSQLITQSAGQKTVSFGGSFLSNLATVSLDYQNYYVPSRAQDPFQRAVIADVQLRAFGRVTLHGATFVDPQGHLKYTANAICLLNRENNQNALSQKIVIGGNMIRGRVIDQSGLPVSGAALQFDESLIFTDSGGRFFLRESRARIHKLTVMTSRFLNEGHYLVVDAPKSLSSGSADRDETVIVIRQSP
jgi:hypothetical protein